MACKSLLGRVLCSRRLFLKKVVGASILSTMLGRSIPVSFLKMPPEDSPHKRTWMAFGARRLIWGKLWLPARKNLALIAKTIQKYEPVFMLTRKEDFRAAKRMVGEAIELRAMRLNDVWLRDSAPVFVFDSYGKKIALDFNFNGWGEKQDYFMDARVAKSIAGLAKVKHLRTELTLEGGGLEVDGAGTALITESSTLNLNRNPGIDKAQFEDLLMPLLGLKKIIWLPGARGKDITDGHIDFYARFASVARGRRIVLVGLEPDRNSYEYAITRQHLELLQNATDAQEKKFEVIPIMAPVRLRRRYLNESFAAGYLGFYVCNGAVLMQEFGDRQADAIAKKALEKAFPGRTVEALNLDAIAAGGGSLHCVTQQEPLSFI